MDFNLATKILFIGHLDPIFDNRKTGMELKIPAQSGNPKSVPTGIYK